MKKLMILAVVAVVSISCKTSRYLGDIGQHNQTQVVLNQANFKCLGSFSGESYSKKKKFNFKNNEGALVQAKLNLIENAKNAGVELTGSRALINITTDIIEHDTKVLARVTAEIIEFTK
ncbi:hypothetical protein LNI98_03980 [Tenacibaculum dicentrarchi]|uniref:DUF6567 family protein n=1 Tax=Tenacibaculum finnmarkense TaxID=2781243 RepID=UPI001E4647A9|nr:DUF6567 family protein [Tenacibaculum finnmarkense]MCD8402291.1 hypothetical protein [Tenacibaculum finnmarkense genomovar finnmarkense]MCD8448841.1 hypothetical protein [Tenacibaculum dicentrarchi]